VLLWLAAVDAATSLVPDPPQVIWKPINISTDPVIVTVNVTTDPPSLQTAVANQYVYWDNNSNIIPPGEYPWDEPEAPEHHFIQYPQSRVLVAPKHKLAFCYIEKNACTEFNFLFDSLNSIDNDTWWNSTAGYQNISLSSLTAANGWKWGVFLRDPAARYLSAWGSKCWQKEDNGWNCRPNADALVFVNSSTEVLASSFEQTTRKNHEDRSRLFDNPHWAQQSMFCGGLRDLSRFDFVGLVNKDMNSQVRQMLHQAHIWHMDSAVDKYFPKTYVHGHSSHLDESLYYRNPETTRLVQEIYQDDYKLIKSIQRKRSFLDRQ